MKFIIDFYKELDTINLIIFWGVIIVVLLLLVFAIIIANKNKKLKQIIISKGIDLDNNKDELPIKKEEISINDQNNIIKENNAFEEKNVLDVIDKPIENAKEEKKFVAEEHVIEYNDDLFSLPNIKKTTEYIEKTNEEKDIPTGPYQRNILREMSLNQTSPIGIVKKESIVNKDINKAKELHDALIENENEENHNNNIQINNYHQKENQITSIDKENNNQENYLNEVSKKLSEATNQDKIDRTEYELKQEAEAIISYEELMQKKDSIKMVDEEEAVISIEELIQRKKQEDKLYKITAEEENDKFISELKQFRSDL